MRGAAALTGLAALGAASCSSPTLALPDEPVARAATCMAVRTLELREGKSASGPVSFDGSTEILHIAMIDAAGEAVRVDLDRLRGVSQRAPMVMAELEGQNWRSLVEPCNGAYPETQRQPPPLPGDTYEAGMTCFALADFLGRASADYPAERSGIADLADRALQAAQPALRQRARDNDEAHRIAAGYAARAFKSGRPAALLDQCRRRFPATAG